MGAACTVAESFACRHGTLVAGVLAARRGSGATAVCPGCTLIVRPIFTESAAGGAREMPAAEPAALAAALLECIRAGVRVINLSAALVRSSIKDERALIEALDFAARRDVLIVAAAGNQGGVGGTPITRHPAVIPVAACDGQGRPLAYTTLSGSIGRRGLLAPGVGVAGLNAAGGVASFNGTSAATPLVTGAIALLWSEFPLAAAADVRQAALFGAVSARRIGGSAAARRGGGVPKPVCPAQEGSMNKVDRGITGVARRRDGTGSRASPPVARLHRA